MINQTRIGANYTPESSSRRRFALNKFLFLVAVLLLYFHNAPLTDYIAVMVLSVPIAKKCAVNILELYFCGEYALILSAELLLILLGRFHSAAFMLIVCHIVDFFLYCFYNYELKSMLENAVLFENPIEYRFNSDGDYILSSSEYIPTEGIVIAGEALVDYGRLGGGDEVISVQPDDKLPPACRIIDGNIIFRPLKNEDNSVYEQMKRTYAELIVKEDECFFVVPFDILKVALTVIILAFSAVVLYMGGFTYFDLARYVAPITLFGCTGIVFIFNNAIDYDFAARLQENGIYMLKRRISREPAILEKDAAFENVDFAEYDLYSASFLKDDAAEIYRYYNRCRTVKRWLIYILAALNVASVVASLIFSVTFPMYLSLFIIVLAIAFITAV